MTDSIIFKILTAEDWAKAQAGADVLAPIDITDGYVHFSTATQVQDTLDKWFQGATDTVLIAFAAGDFADSLKWEPAREGELFPHVYGSVRATQAKGVWVMQIGPSGAPLAPAEALEVKPS